ncbi:MAG: TSUP family transporter [Rariglobus sp.]
MIAINLRGAGEAVKNHRVPKCARLGVRGDSMTFPLWTYPLLFVTGLFAGLVDTVAGGGGVISLPILLNLGMPVPLALGTNKFQACFGSVSATFHFARQGLIDWRSCRLGVAMTAVGAVSGALAIHLIDNALLAQLMPWLLGAIVVYSIVRPHAGSADHPPRMRPGMFFILFGLGLGFYDGFFGPGTGSFWTIALIAVQGFNFVRATATTKLMNATSNVTSLVWFAAAGQVDYTAGAVMGAGQLVGSKLGSGLVVKKGARFIRPIFLTMVVLTVLRLVYVSLTRPQ